MAGVSKRRRVLKAGEHVGPAGQPSTQNSTPSLGIRPHTGAAAHDVLHATHTPLHTACAVCNPEGQACSGRRCYQAVLHNPHHQAMLYDTHGSTVICRMPAPLAMWGAWRVGGKKAGTGARLEASGLVGAGRPQRSMK